MKYFVGVDGGGSKTEALIFDEDARVLGIGRSGPGNYEVSSMEDVKKNWLSAIEKAKSSIGDVKFERACFGLGGADFPEDFVMLKKELKSIEIAPEVILKNDAVIALRAGSKDFWGIIIIMGSGTCGYGKTESGDSFRFYAEGYEFGDWGGSFSVTQDMLHYAFRSYDGRGEKTILEDMVLEYFREKTHDDVAKKLYYNPGETMKAISFGPLLFKAIEAEDKVAIKIGEKIVDETVRNIHALMHKLNLLKEKTPIVLGGSFYKGVLWLPEYISARTHMFAPKATVSLLQSPPVIGAALMAWEASGYSVTEKKWEELSNLKINKAKEF